MAIPAVWLGFIFLAYRNRASEKQEVAQGIANCRQIIAALRTYATDHDGRVLDGPGPGEQTSALETANGCFRGLFTDKVLDKEHIFGCPQSPYVPDGTIGPGPHFPDALKRGENHWMMTKGLPGTVGGMIPLVYENATGAMWNPTWNADMKRKPSPGRTWSEGIIVGLSDNSVALQKLASQEGSAVSLRPSSAAGKNLFTHQEKAFEVLDIER